MKEGWQKYSLADICSVITDGSHFSPKEDVNGSYPMLSVKDMGKNDFDYSSCKHINSTDYCQLVSNGCKPLINDVVVAKDGSYLKSSFVVKEEREQVLLSSIAILRPDTKIIFPNYLAYFFKAPNTKRFIEKNYITGTAIKRVILKGFRALLINIPNISEQEHIVAELDLLSDITEKKKTQLKELDNLAQSIFYDMFGDPVANEKGWKTKRIEEVGNVKIGPFGSLLHNRDYITGGTPLVNPIHMKDGKIIADNDFSISDDKKTELTNYLLKPGDIILARRGDIGRCAMVSDKEDGFICGTGSLYVRPTTSIVPLFLLSQLSSREMVAVLTRQAKGATMLNINCSIVAGLTIILPPINLQKKYCEQIELVENQKTAIKKSIEETQILFDSRMDFYFN